jgi:hypothetical protein
MSFRCEAMCRECARDSITHGPAIRKKGEASLRVRRSGTLIATFAFVGRAGVNHSPDFKSEKTLRAVSTADPSPRLMVGDAPVPTASRWPKLEIMALGQLLSVLLTAQSIW